MDARTLKYHPARQKGGVGKSTPSLLLYEAFRQAEKTVYVDWDPQGTSTKALALMIGEQKITRQQADIIIWDTPPTLDHTATVTAARSANIALAHVAPAIHSPRVCIASLASGILVDRLMGSLFERRAQIIDDRVFID